MNGRRVGKRTDILCAPPHPRHLPDQFTTTQYQPNPVMKFKPLLHGLVLGAALLSTLDSACAQGRVLFNNRTNGVLAAPIYGPEPGDVTLARHGNTAGGLPAGSQTYGGTLLVGPGFTAQLWAGPLGTNDDGLAPVATATFQTGVAAGFIVAPTSAVAVASVPAGSMSTVRVRAWDNLGGMVTTWDAARTNPAVASGASASFVVGPLGTNDASAAILTNLLSFNIHLSAGAPPTTNCLSFAGLQNCPLGGATLISAASQLRVGSIGSTGSNGISVALGEVYGVQIDLQPLDLSTNGASLFLGARGTVNGSNDTFLGQESLVNTGGNHLQVGVDYSSLGTGLVQIEVYSNGLLVSVNTVPAGVLGDVTTPPPALGEIVSASAKPIPGIDIIVKKNQKGIAIHFVAPIVFFGSSGNEIHLIPFNPAGQIASYSSVQMRVANVAEMVILNETILTSPPLVLTCASNKTVECGLGTAGSALPAYTVLRSFSSTGDDGRTPRGAMAEDSDGTFYGTTRAGGSSGYGTVFKLNRDGSGYTNLHSFSGTATGGREPWAGLLVGSDGKLYGTTRFGGLTQGTVFRINKDGNGYTNLHRFSASPDGREPLASLIEGGDGAIYGTTSTGGSNNVGTVFRLDKDGSNYLVLHHCANDGIDGANPWAGVIQASDGLLYGTTRYIGAGGGGGYGTVFKLNPTNGSGYTVLKRFTEPLEGQQPFGEVVEGTNGVLYGTTFAGGSGYGTLFKMEKDGTGFETLRRFSTGAEGRNPHAGLVVGANGFLYGTTYNGGSNNVGTVFTTNPDGTNYRVLHHFLNDGITGADPWAGVIQGGDGALYGTTEHGGSSGAGTVFRLELPCPWSFDPPTVTSGCCGGTNVTLTVLSTVTNGVCPTLVTRTWQATDCCTNTATCSQTVTLVDTSPLGMCPPVIIAHPQSLTVTQGQTATFSVVASGPSPLYYQWLLNGTNISDATNTSYVITNSLPSDVGFYAVVVTNFFGSATSAPAELKKLNVTVGRLVCLNGTPLANCLLTVEFWAGGIRAFSTTATTDSSGNFLFCVGCASVSGQQTDRKFIITASCCPNQTWTVLSHCCCGDLGTLVCNVPPIITQQPVNLIVTAPSAANFSITATGTSLTYQWRKNGVNLANGGNISGANSAILMINPTAATEAGSYDVLISGTCGSVTSAVATLNFQTSMCLPMSNPSFEDNSFTIFPGYVFLNGAINGWSSSVGRLGLNPVAGSSPFADNGAIPHGYQVAFMQEEGVLSQVVGGFTVGAHYRLQYYENSRAWSTGSVPYLEVQLGGATIVAAHPVTPVGGSNPYHVISGMFKATATSLQLAFIKSNPQGGDTTVLIDNVCIVKCDNLVDNGSFENPLVPVNSFSTSLDGTTGVRGWTAKPAGEPIEIWNGNFGSMLPSDLAQHLEISGNATNETVCQVVTNLTPYCPATFCFDYAGRPGFSDNTFTVTLSGGATLSATLNPAPYTQAGGWQHYCVDIVPTTPLLTISFINQHAGDTGGAHIDNVTLTQCCSTGFCWPPAVLSIVQLPNSFISVSWTGSGHLEAAENLFSPVFWVPVSNNSPFITSTIPGGWAFFRVVCP